MIIRNNVEVRTGHTQKKVEDVSNVYCYAEITGIILRINCGFYYLITPQFMRKLLRILK
ncbi:hypothetical protein EZS27_029603 [termite gut metagenome]|uniref:Uncharacterized protein n=1 Tax=termite gut metagenome TaxID=433724 RepID=A0A5J4QIE5_9ZZZZ